MTIVPKRLEGTGGMAAVAAAAASGGRKVGGERAKRTINSNKSLAALSIQTVARTVGQADGRACGRTGRGG